MIYLNTQSWICQNLLFPAHIIQESVKEEKKEGKRINYSLHWNKL